MVELKYVVFMIMFVTLVPTAAIAIIRFPKFSWLALFTAIFFYCEYG